MTFDGPIGSGTLYLAVYRKSDGAYRTTGTTFAAISGLSDSQWRSGLFTATEQTNSDGKGTGCYSWSSGNLPVDYYTVKVFDANSGIGPDGIDGSSVDHHVEAFNFAANGAGGSANLNNVLDLQQATWAVDQNVTPWALVALKKGTGGIGTGTELLRQNLKQIDGSDITATTQVVAQKVA